MREEETKHTAYAGEAENAKWELVAPFMSEHKTLIRTFDARLYPNSERVIVASVDPQSTMPIEAIEPTARFIVRACNAWNDPDALRARLTELEEVSL